MEASYSPKLVRVFIVHPKAVDTLLDLTGALERDAKEKWPPPTHTIQLTLGRDDWERNFSRCGSWNEWTRDVAERVLGPTREPRYHGVMVPYSETIGRATKDIVMGFLRLGKPALEWRPGEFRKITTVDTVDSESFKAGWQLRTVPFWKMP